MRKSIDDLYPKIVDDGPSLLDFNERSTAKVTPPTSTIGSDTIPNKTSGKNFNQITQPSNQSHQEEPFRLNPSLISVFISTVSGNLKTKRDQRQLFTILDSQQIPYQWYDVSSDVKAREFVMSRMGKKYELPVLFRGSQSLGNVDAMQEALDDEGIHNFLGLSDDHPLPPLLQKSECHVPPPTF